MDKEKRLKKWIQKIYHKWLCLTIKKKIDLFMAAFFSIIFFSFLFDCFVVRIALGDFTTALEDNLRTSDFMDSLEEESRSFRNYIKTPSENTREELEMACVETKHAISRLPFKYDRMSKERYAKTWSIKNSYKIYEEERDRVLTLNEETADYIKQLYQVYQMQSFLQEYGRNLMRYSLEDQNVIYTRKLPIIERTIVIGIIIGIIIMIIMYYLANLLHKTLITPIVNLVDFSKKIASNQFYVEDVVVENKDEMGELVKAFNKMKYVMGEYISTLEEKRKTLDLLHKEELEKLEIEKRLESTKLELLRNQINPHFLFNTLNVIAGMANLEDAHTTERMITALSSLFRYNLKTPDADTTLTQELRIAQNYMYLQQMRFGSRLEYSISCDLDEDHIMIPTFTFQPLIENAIIHGISKKEEGGRIIIRIFEQEEKIVITIADTGVGMPDNQVTKIRQALYEEHMNEVGIGLGNIYKRIHNMYKNGIMELYSKEGNGTVIRIILPQ